MEILKQHWLQVLESNKNLIIECAIKTQMAEEMIKFVETKLSEFPNDEK